MMTISRIDSYRIDQCSSIAKPVKNSSPADLNMAPFEIELKARQNLISLPAVETDQGAGEGIPSTGRRSSNLAMGEILSDLMVFHIPMVACGLTVCPGQPEN